MKLSELPLVMVLRAQFRQAVLLVLEYITKFVLKNTLKPKKISLFEIYQSHSNICYFDQLLFGCSLDFLKKLGFPVSQAVPGLSLDFLGAQGLPGCISRENLRV